MSSAKFGKYILVMNPTTKKYIRCSVEFATSSGQITVVDATNPKVSSTFGVADTVFVRLGTYAFRLEQRANGGALVLSTLLHIYFNISFAIRRLWYWCFVCFVRYCNSKKKISFAFVIVSLLLLLFYFFIKK